MNRTHHYFTRALLRVCLLLGLLPTGAKAQLFGGMIKANSPIVLASNQNFFVSSIYDTDYLPYTAPSGAGTTGTQAANGLTNDPGETAVNVQGQITTTGVTVYIPCTTTTSGTLPAYSTTVTIPAAVTEDGVSRDVTLSWASQAYTLATKSIKATLQAVGGTLNVKKLDINAGIGNNYLGVLLGQLVYPINTVGATSTFSVRDLPGIPDKMFGLADNGGVVRHNFLYLPVVGEDGKVWLNNNLGADYANINSTSFNTNQQATAYTDYHAYGSLFQYGRKPDGHELISWSASNTGTPVNTSTATLSDNPTDALFITNAVSGFWQVSTIPDQWRGVASVNNPCPVLYRLPNLADIQAMATNSGATTAAGCNGKALGLTMPGYRNNGGGNPYNMGSALYYMDNDGGAWSPNTYIPPQYYMYPRAIGGSVRCIRN